MTTTEVLKSTADMLTPAEVASVIGCNPQSIRDQAQAAPGMLGFPVSVIGTRVMIPRVAFCLWMGYPVETINGIPVFKSTAGGGR